MVGTSEERDRTDNIRGARLARAYEKQEKTENVAQLGPTGRIGLGLTARFLG